MADDANLELPKLFRRRRKDTDRVEPEADPAPDAPSQPEAPLAAPAAEGAGAPTEQLQSEAASVEVAPAPASADPAPAVEADPSEPPAEPAPEAPRAEVSTTADLGEPAERTRVLADGPPPPVAVRDREEPADAAEPEPERGPRLTLPQMPGALAAALTGLVVGAVSVALVLGAGLGCRAVGGTSSCGGGPGTLILLGILALAVVVGTILLRACGVAEGLSVSALAVGLVGVAVMLFLLEVVFSAWMILVIPLLTIGAFALAWWVTVRLAAEAAADLD